MNKLLVNSKIEINNLVIDEDTGLKLELSNDSKKIHIIVEDNVCLSIIDIGFNTSNNIEIVLNNNSRVLYNKFCINSNDSIYTLLNGYGSDLIINNSLINNSNSKMKFLIEHNNINTTSKLSNHGVNNSNGKLYFNVDSKINISTDSSSASQENRIINMMEGESKILPNLLVDNYDVNASHSAYISNFDKKTMFYLNSRGIRESDAKKLLLEGFLVGNLDLDNDIKNSILEMVKM